MLCEKCGRNNASVHITKNINGRVTELHLCEECAKKSGQMVSVNRFFNDFFESVLPARSRRRFPLLEDTTGYDSRYAGCEDCIGEGEKTPGEAQPPNRVELLKKQMQQAVEQEDFETAAKIRDEIKKLNENNQK